MLSLIDRSHSLKGVMEMYEDNQKYQRPNKFMPHEDQTNGFFVLVYLRLNNHTWSVRTQLHWWGSPLSKILRKKWTDMKKLPVLEALWSSWSKQWRRKSFSQESLVPVVQISVWPRPQLTPWFFFLLPKLPQIMSLTCSWSWRGCGRNWRHRCLCYPAGIDQHWHSVGGCRALKLYIWGPLFFWLAGRASQFRGLQVDLRVDWDHRECALEGLALDLEWLLNHLLIL